MIQHLFFSDLFHLERYPLGSSMSLQMARYLFLIVESYFILYMYIHMYFFSIHSSIYGYLGCFHIMVMVIINKAAINIGVHISFQISGVFFLWISCQSGIAGSLVIVLVLKSILSCIATPALIFVPFP